MSNGEVRQSHTASFCGSSRRTEDQNPEQEKITRRKISMKLVNETSTSTMLEEKININANFL